MDLVTIRWSQKPLDPFKTFFFPQGCLGMWGKFNRCLGTGDASGESEAGQHA